MHAAVRLGHVAEDGRLPRLRTELALADAIVAAEIGDRERARCTLVDLAGQSTYPIPSLQLVAKLELVQLYVATGQIEDALSEFEVRRPSSGDAAADRVASRAPDGPRSASWLLSSLSRVGVTLVAGDRQPGRRSRVVKRVADPFWGPMCEAKLHLARGHHGGPRRR